MPFFAYDQLIYKEVELLKNEDDFTVTVNVSTIKCLTGSGQVLIIAINLQDKANGIQLICRENINIYSNLNQIELASFIINFPDDI